MEDIKITYSGKYEEIFLTGKQIEDFIGWIINQAYDLYHEGEYWRVMWFDRHEMRFKIEFMDANEIVNQVEISIQKNEDHINYEIYNAQYPYNNGIIDRGIYIIK
ncbi:hypothetical protein [Bacillus sp. AFS017336]|uniref:hypothetical protein n=1 Tax=Bacillus sp. AFS017336 TaxID=2033489 RepID=UPI000BF1FD95|nr:hypothetical protein [Bacillus sp. AFS017336]PEL07797.1 hypothetical protein CN601_19085 [Bacillus sp. AFS017336]